jgi:hypothetical protein
VTKHVEEILQIGNRSVANIAHILAQKREYVYCGWKKSKKESGFFINEAENAISAVKGTTMKSIVLRESFSVVLRV